MNNNSTLIGILIGLVVVAGLYIALADKPDNSPNITFEQTNPPSPSTASQNPPSGSTTTPKNTSNQTQTVPAATAARKHLSAKLATSEGNITVTRVEERSWSDGCLGLGGPAESCIQMIVDGYRIEMRAEGKTYVYRTDKTGTSLRAEAN